MTLAGLRFRPRLWAFALASAGCAAGILLGNWQSGRAAEKRAGQAALQRVALRGEFLPQYTVLLDFRVHRGRPGYHVVQPLRVAQGGSTCSCLRGWVAADARRERLPHIVTPAGEQGVEGPMLERLPQYLEQQGGQDACRFGPAPCVRQNLKIEDFGAWTGLPIKRVVIEQSNELADGLVREWQRPEAAFRKNEMYALQWYSLAALCVILFLVLSVRRDGPASR
jgi:surfeit locus 1 family protein